MSKIFRTAALLALVCAAAALTPERAAAQSTDVAVEANSESITTTTQGNAQSVSFNSATPLGRTELVTVPDAIAPSIVGGNPCVVSASIAGSGLGFGFSAGVGLQDPECEARQQVALLVNMGAVDVAIARFCMEEAVREAFRMANRP